MESKSWSASLEHEEYAEDRDLVIKHGLESIMETAKGCHVNLVTPNEFGNPEHYLSELIVEKFGSTVEVKYIDQCGCGGHVLRVYK